MNTLFSLLAGALIGGGAYMALSRNALRLLLGLILITNGVNLALLVAGRFRRAAPPFVPEGSTVVDATAVTNPLPQALVLTAIVIGLGIFAFVLALLLPTSNKFQTLDVNAIRAAEEDGDEEEEPSKAS